MEKDLINMLSLIQTEKDDEFNMMKAHIKKTEDMNSFLKVAKNSLAEKVVVQYQNESKLRNNKTEAKRNTDLKHDEGAW